MAKRFLVFIILAFELCDNNTKAQENIVFTVNGVSFEMVYVESGTFTMGCTYEQGDDCDNCYDETPVHSVTISNDYYIGKFEVTQKLYEAVMRTNPSDCKDNDLPVDNVSWNDAMEFCTVISHLTGRRFTLPTEAEWEFAARGGSKANNTKYSGSASIYRVAWYKGNTDWYPDKITRRTYPVGMLLPNELGIYDMSGNVLEWCLDWYGNYVSASQTDPMGPDSGPGRVLRGGCSNSNAYGCRIPVRYVRRPNNYESNVGFRIVLH